MEKTKEVKVKIKGGVSMYPSRIEVIKKVKEGEIVGVTYNVSGDKIIAEINNEIVGTVEFENSTKVDDISKLLPLYGNITSVKNGNLEGNMIIPGEIKKIEVGTIDEQIDRLLLTSQISKEQIMERVEYLKENKVEERIIVKTLKNINPREEIMDKIYKPETLYINKGKGNILNKVLVYFNSKKNILLEGGRGVGKNVLTETLSWLYCRPLYEISLNSQLSNSAILGTQTFDDSGKIVFKKSPVIEAMETGGILVLDEFNAALSHVMLLLNSVLDNRRRIEVPMYKQVVAHPDFMVIATQNTSVYTGVFKNNEATLDRFVPIIFETSPSITDLILQKVEFVHPDSLKIIQEIHEGIVNLINQGEVSEKSLSIRGFIDACSVLDDLTLKDALLDNVVNKAMDEDRESIRVIIDMLIK